MEKARNRYPDFEKTRDRAARVITPLKPADIRSNAPEDMLFVAKRTDASGDLPEPYLVYFMLVDLLDFKDLGRWEKLAYSIPVDFNGTAYLVEHRKFGLGLFSADPEAQEDDAKAIVHLIRKAVKAAQPYFEHLANEAAEGSRLNLRNHSRAHYDRYIYFRKIFRENIERRRSTRNRSTPSAYPACRTVGPLNARPAPVLFRRQPHHIAKPVSPSKKNLRCPAFSDTGCAGSRVQSASSLAMSSCSPTETVTSVASPVTSMADTVP